MTGSELNKIITAHKAAVDTIEGFGPPVLMVGFNRRFAPHSVKIKSLLEGVVGPKSFVMTVNAGAVEPNHWTQDVEIGGGRILGEVCHFIDLLRFLCGKRIEGWQILTLDDLTRDTASIQLAFADGSIGTIHYFCNGSRKLAKERLEVFAQGGVLRLDNFRELSAYGWKNFNKMRLWKQDKGQKACVEAFINSIRKPTEPPIAFEEIVEVSKICIELVS